MWQSSCSKSFPGVTRTAVWRVASGVGAWPTRTEEVEHTRFDGAFARCPCFTLKARDGLWRRRVPGGIARGLPMPMNALVQRARTA